MKQILILFILLSGITLFGQSNIVQNNNRKIIPKNISEQSDTLQSKSNILLMSRNFRMIAPTDTVIYEDKKSTLEINKGLSMDKNLK